MNLNGAHLHLILNHFPFIGTLFASLVIGFGLLRKSESIQRVGLVLFVLTGMLTIPAFLTGEPAEDVLKKFPNFSKDFIHPHEEAAEKMVWLMWVTTAFAAFVYYRMVKMGRPLRRGIEIVLVLALIVLGAAAWVNSLGGMIQHPETRETPQ